VLSVGAIDDSTNEKASFSNYNDEVDVAAPGVQVLSTGLPSSAPVVFLSPSESGGAVAGKWWQASGQVASQSGILIDCGTGIDAPCDTSAAGGGASICLIQRYAMWVTHFVRFSVADVNLELASLDQVKTTSPQ
jgi:subtilisin family serine protease